MKEKIKINKKIYDFPEDVNYPQDYVDSIFIPTYGTDFIHYYYLVEFATKKIIYWEVDLSGVVNELKNKMGKFKNSKILLNLTQFSHENLTINSFQYQ